MFGQNTSDTILLPEVLLSETKLYDFKIGINYEIINPTIIGLSSAATLSEQLSNYSNIYIKEYGALATPAFRGTSSSHTSVLWNGIAINSVANGLVDFSSINMLKNHQIILSSSAYSSAFGSGSIGGSIHFNTHNIQNYKDEISFSRKFGSFGFNSNSLRFVKKYKKLSVFGSTLVIKDKNRFKFRNTSVAGNPYQVNTYGEKKVNESNLNVKYELNRNNDISTHYWYNNTYREVPQNLSTSLSDAKQYDRNNRFLIISSHRIDNYKIKIKQAYLKENFRYTELSKNIDSRYLTESYLTEAKIKLKLKNTYNVGGSFNTNLINNNNYINSKIEENQLSAYASANFIFNYFKINSTIRKEWETNYKVPLLPSISAEMNLNNKNKIRARYSKNFRAPTFNDRFWISSSSIGNENLKSENANNFEVGFDHENKKFDFKVSCFSIYVNNWISWVETNNIWSPENIKEVWSRGLESKLIVNYRNSSVTMNYSLTKTTTQKSINYNDLSTGQQLRYVPLHKGNILISYSKNEIKYYLNSAYTGEVITSYGTNNNKLKDFVLTSFGLIYNPSNIPLEFEFNIKNLMDLEYQTYQNYPTPGREFFLTINYTIN